MAAAANKLETMALWYAEHGLAVFPLQPRSKEPYEGSHGFADATTDAERIKKWWGNAPESNIGIATGAKSGGLVAIDMDVHPERGEDGTGTLKAWEAEHGELPDTVAVRTGSGGIHALYRSSTEVRNSANGMAGVDIRGWGGFIVAPPSVHPSGGEYEWINDPFTYEIADAEANTMAFIESVRPNGGTAERRQKLEVADSVDHDRNDTLYRMACSMQSQSMPDDVVVSAINEYNAKHCRPPLPRSEVAKLLRSALGKPKGHSEEVRQQKQKQNSEGNSKPTPGKPKKFNHSEIAKRLMTERHACFIDGAPAIYDGDHYRMGWDGINAATIEMADTCTISNRREVNAYLQVMAPYLDQEEPDLIQFRNGVLDIRTLEFRDATDDDIIPNIVPHDWNPAAECWEVDGLLERLACGSTETQMNLCETAGLCIYRNASRYPFCPVLIGSGSNGKSTYIKLLRWAVGRDNVSAMQPGDIPKRFQALNIVGKTANLGDDIAGGYLDEDACSAIKRIATGDRITTDVKGTQGFDFTPYCTMVFSCNVFPRLQDTSDGMMRRLFPIEFNARFSRDDPDFDPAIGEKLETEEAAERLLVLAVEALCWMADTKQMTPTETSERIKGEIVSENNTVIQWANEMAEREWSIDGRSKSDAYRSYAAWCDDNGYGKYRVSSGKFSAQIRTFLGFELCGFAEKAGGGRIRVYRRPGLSNGS